MVNSLSSQHGLPPSVAVYCVGGAVRDRLLGLPIQDRDWVVVGATPAMMLAAGYLPVGQDFPVFLHPRTKQEYALARTERKTAQGYHGFQFYCAPDVTLEQDLARRDLTINAMAEDASGALIDPYGGQADLAAKCLRHVGPAFTEDPVRLLRLARFAARLPEFSVAPTTADLLAALVTSGELDALIPERVWQELSQGLMTAAPARMLQVLRQCGALARILPEVDALYGVPQRADYHPEIDTGLHVELVLNLAAQLDSPLSVRFAALTHDLGKAGTPAHVLPRHLGHESRSVALIGPLCERLRVPNDCRELALLVAQEHGHIHGSLTLSAPAIVRLLERCDAWRRPQRFADCLLACEADYRGRAGWGQKTYPAAAHLQAALAATQTVKSGEIAQTLKATGAELPQATASAAMPTRIKQAIFAARVAAIEPLLLTAQS
ncbi:multifunctional CCA addition/repair protein [Parvibium lacunae]|uniref:Multifunctional CCA protein n=1 Tax=Parvibium lacunae TaxID=1888893 RepID=A0A368KYV0_9BURK|nr:multifunctional CCA addition/repair protein [Parvibium lacunae]RCS56576.1 multifunctional CCA addition/repair protein [Parvibium lacunae]